MSIVRTFHNKENPYVILNKKPLFDSRLSLKAVGLWARCMSRPDNWSFSIAQMVKEGKEGKTAIYSVIDELIEMGYCLRFNRTEKDNGHFSGVEYVILEFSVTSAEEIDAILEELKKKQPHTGFRRTGETDPENQPLLSNEEKHVKKQQQGPVAVAASDVDEKRRLLEPHGEQDNATLLKIPIERLKQAIECANAHQPACWAAYVLESARRGWKAPKSTNREDVKLSLIEKVRAFDGKKLKGWAVSVGEKYVEFWSGGVDAATAYSVDSKTFTDDVKAFFKRIAPEIALA